MTVFSSMNRLTYPEKAMIPVRIACRFGRGFRGRSPPVATAFRSRCAAFTHTHAQTHRHNIFKRTRDGSARSRTGMQCALARSATLCLPPQRRLIMTRLSSSIFCPFMSPVSFSFSVSSLLEARKRHFCRYLSRCSGRSSRRCGHDGSVGD